MRSSALKLIRQLNAQHDRYLAIYEDVQSKAERRRSSGRPLITERESDLLRQRHTIKLDARFKEQFLVQVLNLNIRIDDRLVMRRSGIHDRIREIDLSPMTVVEVRDLILDRFPTLIIS